MNILQQTTYYLISFLLSILPSVSYTEGIVGQPASFFPNQSATQNDKTISNLIYRGLFKYDIYGMLAPDLADSWAISDDGIVYTVKLKERQRWSDGSLITSDDLIYTAFKTPALRDVATDKIDEKTVRYTLPNKFSPFLSLLSEGVMKSNAEESSNRLFPITSGKFKVVRVKDSGPIVKEVVLYNTSSADNIRKLIFRYYSNDEELSLAARLGEIDGFLSQNYHELPGFENYKFPQQGVYYALFFNLRKDSVNDLDLRSSLLKTLPLDKLISAYGVGVQGAISRSPFTDNELKFDKYDEKFIASYPNKGLALTVPDVKTHTDLAKKITEVWKEKLGIKTQIITISPNDIEEKVIKPKNFEILLYGQEIGRDPDRYINWHSTQEEPSGLNLTGFKHVRADRALEEGRNEYDNKKRSVHYSEFQKVIDDQLPAIFLYHPFINYYVNSYITGIGNKYTFSTSDRFLDLFNWKRIETD